mmetsp:Transcript_73320/g.238642  ORF Transcript_73320/g.238642 Transcript_73320/m.238642 type:complete len:296 (+) Transcript_73320:632-1519(+)
MASPQPWRGAPRSETRALSLHEARAGSRPAASQERIFEGDRLWPLPPRARQLRAARRHASVHASRDHQRHGAEPGGGRPCGHVGAWRGDARHARRALPQPAPHRQDADAVLREVRLVDHLQRVPRPLGEHAPPEPRLQADGGKGAAASLGQERHLGAGPTLGRLGLFVARGHQELCRHARPAEVGASRHSEGLGRLRLLRSSDDLPGLTVERRWRAHQGGDASDRRARRALEQDRRSDRSVLNPFWCQRGRRRQRTRLDGVHGLGVADDCLRGCEGSSDQSRLATSQRGCGLEIV